MELSNDITNTDTDVAGTPGGVLVPHKAVGALEKSTVDLGLHLDEVRRTPGSESHCKTTRAMQEETDPITLEYLWTRFQPGELIFSSTFMDCPQSFIVKYRLDSYIEKGASDRKWVLECWTYDWKEINLHRTLVELSLKDFKGTKSITSLTCYPLRFIGIHQTMLVARAV